MERLQGDGMSTVAGGLEGNARVRTDKRDEDDGPSGRALIVYGWLQVA
jgi:hypothetical protein